MPTVIEAQVRTPEGKNANRRLRQSGKIPAVLYGPSKQPTVLSLDPVVIWNILHSESGQNTIFAVNIEGAGQSNAMVKAYQRDPIKGALIHTDLLEIDMNRLLTLEVNIEISGEPQGVKLDGGTLDFVTRAIEVECLPADIPESVKLDVTALKINDYIRVKDLQLGDKVKILTEPEIVIVTVAPPQKEVAAEAAAAAEPEVVKKGKPEEAAGDKAKKK
ncbi:MAG: 50S ribosomal protein L25 [Acidobacteriota bacterium]|jgi:large subunit ribosomal protein L25|nr:50S ribosomal protein L25 [Acidobacteriota bacterium]